MEVDPSLLDKYRQFDLMEDARLSLNYPALYIIRHTATGRFYIGSTGNVTKRKSHHQWTLKNNQHSNRELQLLYAGDPGFKIDVYEVDSKEVAGEWEQKYITQYMDHPDCLNVAVDITSPTKGRAMEQSHKDAIRDALTGRVMNEDWRGKLAIAKLGTTQSEETKAKRSLAMREAAENDPWQQRANTAAILVTSKPVSIDGVIYVSVAAACRELGLTTKVVSRRLHSSKTEYDTWYFVNKETTMADNVKVLPDPAKDGITHINVYTKGMTWLGQQLSNMSYYSFAHPKHGVFGSLEAYWYWLATGQQHEELRNLAGFKAKLVGKQFERVPVEDFEEQFKFAMQLRLEQNPIIAKALCESHLPFEHYFCYSGKVVDQSDAHRWQLDFYEQWRKDHPVEDQTIALLISGSRKEKNYEAFKKIVIEYLEPYRDKIKDTYKIAIISGLAWDGPDDMAIRLCREEGFMLIGIPAKWNEHGKAAGMIRNGVMGRLCTQALVFWDGESPGTKGQIDYLKKNNIDHLVYIHGKHDPDWKSPEAA